MLGVTQPPRHGQKQGQSETPPLNSGVTPPRRTSPSNPSQGYNPSGPRQGQPQQPYTGRKDYAQSGPPAPGPAAARPNYRNTAGSPPPQGYGFGPPPANPTHSRPLPTSRPPRTPHPPANAPILTPSDEAHELFP